MVLYAGHWMQFLPHPAGKNNRRWGLENADNHLTMEKALVYPTGARVVLHYLEGGKLRVVGSMNDF